ncbi:MAG: type II toxin-antitoxin system MqsA family antitoxin [Ktedonobacterales bacterium]
MNCVICKQGETHRGTTTVTLEPDPGTLVVIREVPAEVCQNCGEAYTDEETTERLLQIAGQARQSGVQVDVRRYIAA